MTQMSFLFAPQTPVLPLIAFITLSCNHCLIVLPTRECELLEGKESKGLTIISLCIPHVTALLPDEVKII